MNRSTRFVATCLGALALLLLLVILVAGPGKPSAVSIDFVGNTNSPLGPLAVLRLSNQGETTVRLDPYCTLYWTNSAGAQTNAFFKLAQAYAILRPGQSSLVALPHPSEARFWETSFTFQVRPSAVKRIVNRIRFVLPGNWVPDNSFTGRFGPRITNPVFGADSALQKE